MPTDPAVAALQREVEELKLALIADRGRIDWLLDAIASLLLEFVGAPRRPMSIADEIISERMLAGGWRELAPNNYSSGSKPTSTP